MTARGNLIESKGHPYGCPNPQGASGRARVSDGSFQQRPTLSQPSRESPGPNPPRADSSFSVESG